MILPFSTQINGKPTNFVSKIWSGIESDFSKFDNKNNRVFDFPKEYRECGRKGLLTFLKQKPKIHTFREDKNNRWKHGTVIDFYINTRTKNMFRFAPRIPVISTQIIQIIYKKKSVFFMSAYPADIYVDKRKLEVSEVVELSRNDGFDTVDDFFNYFKNDFFGKIIHWTDKKY